jgi:hypothetical protein
VISAAAPITHHASRITHHDHSSRTQIVKEQPSARKRLAHGDAHDISLRTISLVIAPRNKKQGGVLKKVFTA